MECGKGSDKGPNASGMQLQLRTRSKGVNQLKRVPCRFNATFAATCPNNCCGNDRTLPMLTNENNLVVDSKKKDSLVTTHQQTDYSD